MGIESHYHQKKGKILIELKLQNIQQLFNTLDPSPFYEQDLDNDAEDYIMNSVNDFSLKTPLSLVLHLNQELSAKESRDSLRQAIHNFFSYRATMAQHELRFTLRQGRISLLIGLGFLVFCIMLRQLISTLGASPWYDLLAEGSLISGWVAMWWPIHTFLYAWWPIRDKQKKFEKLSQIDVEVEIHSSVPQKTV
ncbi:hypothetical protein WDW89_25405 [Deltaproteobacteria bacterium TL4]